MRLNIGKVACNATNGVYVGRIVDVAMYSAVGQAASPVYVVEREPAGRRQNSPPGNTVVVPDRCSDGQPATQAQALRGSAPASAPVTVDPTLANVATEFSRRLINLHGTLQSLQSRDGTITVKWTSAHCDMAEGEVIDFLLSLNRGHPGKVNEAIAAERTCEGSTRRFATTAERVEEYRAGRINDTEILRGLR
jgi:hypothetical protein